LETLIARDSAPLFPRCIQQVGQRTYLLAAGWPWFTVAFTQIPRKKTVFPAFFLYILRISPTVRMTLKRRIGRQRANSRKTLMQKRSCLSRENL